MKHSQTHLSLILQCLYKHGKSDTKKIASLTGLTAKQISKRIADLIKVGCVYVVSDIGCKRVFDAK